MSSSNNGDEPTAKRQRRSLGASDRIVLDVGDNWIESAGSEDEVFIDQDPDPFKVLLAYMRRGIIKVGDIDTNVLVLAEFLGVERLLFAVKARWYNNIGKGPVYSTDEEIAAGFDQKYGGIMKAISDGLFSYFLNQNKADAEKDYAVLTILPTDVPNNFEVKEVGTGQEFRASHIIGALNALHLKGYSNMEKELNVLIDRYRSYTFSRRKHSNNMASGTTNILILAAVGEENNQIKQFALFGVNKVSGGRRILAPAEFSDDENPFNTATIYAGPQLNFVSSINAWREDNGFTTRESKYENSFDRYVEPSIQGIKEKIYSRKIASENADQSWNRS